MSSFPRCGVGELRGEPVDGCAQALTGVDLRFPAELLPGQGDVGPTAARVVDWAVEGGAPNAMFRRGWNKESIPAGVQVTVDGYRAKNGENKANGKDVLLPDGRKLFVGSSGTGAPYDPAAQKK